MLRHHDFMAIALDVARLGEGRTSPNPVVGAVIVKKGKIVATGFHRRAGMPHAEIEAIQNYRGGHSGLQNATLYITLEPCCHEGRTPPCTEAILQSGIREVIIGMRDPDRRVSGKGIRFLKKHGIKVREGILRAPYQRLNEAYIKHRKTGLPFVILKAASTLDGKVAMKDGPSKWITGEESRNFGHQVRDRVDAILVGVDTILQDDPRLTTRIKNKKGKDPVRIVLDSNLRISPRSRVLHLASEAPTWIATVKKPNHPKVSRLRQGKTDIIFCLADKEGRVDLKDLLRQIGKRDIVSLLVEGGPTVLSSFVRQGLADKMMLFLAPSFLGERGLPLFSGLQISSLKRMIQLKDISCQGLGPDLLLEGYFSK